MTPFKLWLNENWLKNAALATPESAYEYALATGHRIPEVEELLLKNLNSNPEPAYEYALNITKNRWPEFEETILNPPPNNHDLYLWKIKCARTAIRYAANKIKDRWPQLEPLIKTNPELATYYAQYVIKGPWPDAEPHIKQESHDIYRYAKDVIQDRWPEGEEALLKLKNTTWIYLYAKDIIQDRWPDAEPILEKDPPTWNHYKWDVLKRLQQKD